jgi:hypothetical protein
MFDTTEPLNQFHKSALVIVTGILATLDADAHQQINAATLGGAVLNLEIVDLPSATKIQLWLVEKEGARTPVACVTTSAATLQ